MIIREIEIVNQQVAINYARVARFSILFIYVEDSKVAVGLKQNDTDDLSSNRK